MKKIFTLIVLLFIVTGCSSDTVNENVEIIEEIKPDLIIVAYGDSLTEGLGVDRVDAYPSQLEKVLNERGYNVKVYNSGSSGETSTGALERVDWVLQLKPQVVILVTGANDAFRGVDLEITESNINAIIKKMKEQNVKVVLGGMEISENLGPEYVSTFKKMYPRIASENDVIFIPSFLGKVAGSQELNQKDGIHPTPEGYSIIVNENILPILEESVLK